MSTMSTPTPAAASGASSIRTSREPVQELLNTLFMELFQTERSADVHSLREADRLGSAPPALALRGVAAHAQDAMVEIIKLSEALGFADTRVGVGMGSMFSQVRDGLADHLISRERSYRATLLGMRHGQDVVRSVRFVAEAAGELALSSFCETWLERRAPLVDGVAAELAWFARNPESALEGGKGAWRARVAGALGLG